MGSNLDWYPNYSKERNCLNTWHARISDIPKPFEFQTFTVLSVSITFRTWITQPYVWFWNTCVPISDIHCICANNFQQSTSVRTGNNHSSCPTSSKFNRTNSCSASLKQFYDATSSNDNNASSSDTSANNTWTSDASTKNRRFVDLGSFFKSWRNLLDCSGKVPLILPVTSPTV